MKKKKKKAIKRLCGASNYYTITSGQKKIIAVFGAPCPKKNRVSRSATTFYFNLFFILHKTDFLFWQQDFVYYVQMLK